jgi:hypothetical protein
MDYEEIVKKWFISEAKVTEVDCSADKKLEDYHPKVKLNGPFKQHTSIVTRREDGLGIIVVVEPKLPSSTAWSQPAKKILKKAFFKPVAGNPDLVRSDRIILTDRDVLNTDLVGYVAVDIEIEYANVSGTREYITKMTWYKSVKSAAGAGTSYKWRG